MMLVHINDIVASMMVLPNRQVFQLVDGIQIGQLRYSNPQVWTKIENLMISFSLI